MANEQRNEQQGGGVDPQQEQSRGEIIPGKGFDPGTGYGGAGNTSAYSGESSYGGQAGIGWNTLRGAYAGEDYGRQGDEQGGGSGSAGGPGTEGGAESSAGAAGAGGSGVLIPRGTDEHAESDGQPNADDVSPHQVDPEGQLGAARRDPTR